ncbi:MAG TPA: glycosyltransferase 87 family protein [Anaeromyxobacteraceae bacterium]|nr:glycosyltransferase 87 family protein [Anaeromyxobacteraceae bacterium]
MSPEPRRAARLAAAALLPLAAVALVLGLLLGARRPYGLDDVSDVGLYLQYGVRLLAGQRPYLDFAVEYPPLALPLFALPALAARAAVATRLFQAEMLALLGAAAVATVAAAGRIWPGAGRERAVGLLFAGLAAALGAVLVNRYDAAVTLAVAAALWLSVAGRHTAAAAWLGAGFALKLAPAVLLPLLLVLAGSRRPAVRTLLAFAAAAALPFVAPLVRAGPEALGALFAYHLARPLQLESLLATPALAGHLLLGTPLAVASTYGSQNLASAAGDLLARASGPLALLAVGATLALAWRRREALRARPEAVPLAALALLLALLATGKVLSPQYLGWLLAPAALALPRFRAPGLAVAAALLLTHLEFPARYWAFVALRPDAVALVVARNAALALAFGLSLAALWRLPAAPAAGRPG